MNEADPRGVISSWIAQNGFQASHQWYGSVQLALVGFGPSHAPTQRVDAALDNGIVLEGYRLGSRSLRAGETLALTLLWRADSGPTLDHSNVFTHFLERGSRCCPPPASAPPPTLRPTTPRN